MPPRSKWARKKFSEPAVAIAEEAEISSARAAAATICAKRTKVALPRTLNSLRALPWTIGADGKIASSRGTYDQAEYERQLQHGFDE